LRPLNHTYHCCIFVAGPYSYAKGPTGAPVDHFRIVNCRLRNAYQRGVAFYSVIRSGVYACRIEDTEAEGIDFDHFCYDCEAVDNELINCRNLELNDASDCLISGNTLRNMGTGIVIWQWCTLPNLNVRNLILNNLILDAKGPGIQCRKGADRNTFRGNIISGAGGSGIFVEGNDNIIDGNKLLRNGQRGIHIVGEGNLVLANQCTDNGAAKPGQYAGIDLQGTGNHAVNNISENGKSDSSQRLGLLNTGKDNVLTGNQGKSK